MMNYVTIDETELSPRKKITIVVLVTRQWKDV